MLFLGKDGVIIGTVVSMSVLLLLSIFISHLAWWPLAWNRLSHTSHVFQWFFDFLLLFAWLSVQNFVVIAAIISSTKRPWLIVVTVWNEVLFVNASGKSLSTRRSIWFHVVIVRHDLTIEGPPFVWIIGNWKWNPHLIQMIIKVVRSLDKTLSTS